MNFDEKRLHQTLINLTRNLKHKEFHEYRKERNWVKYDAMTPIERLQLIFREIKEYQNGYIEDEYNDY